VSPGHVTVAQMMSMVPVDSLRIPTSPYQEQMLRWTLHCERAQLSGELVEATAQQRGVLMSNGRSDGYMMSQAVDLTSGCTEEVVRTALAALVCRHLILRTHYEFNVATNTFDQVIRAEDGFVVPLAICVSSDEWHACLQRTGFEPFDVLATPPIRAALLLDATDESIRRISFTMHHASTDLESMHWLASELAQLCEQILRGEPIDESKRWQYQYADFAVEQRRDSDEPQRRLGPAHPVLEWWCDKLVACPEVTGLPLDHALTPVQCSRVHCTRVDLKSPLGWRLREMSSSVGSTPLCGLFAMFSSLLMHWGKCDTVMFGLPVVSRPVPSVVGYFSNDLPLCFTSSMMESCLQTATKLAMQEMKQAIAHSEATYARLVDARFQATGALPSPAYRSLYQVMLQVLPSPPGATAEQISESVDAFIHDRQHMSEMDLMMTLLGPTPDGGIPGAIRYDSAKYDEQTIKRLVAAFAELVERALEEPDVAIGVHLERVGGPSV